MPEAGKEGAGARTTHNLFVGTILLSLHGPRPGLKRTHGGRDAFGPGGGQQVRPGLARRARLFHSRLPLC